MSKGLYATMAIGVIFVASSLVEEGGVIDKVANADKPPELAQAEADSGPTSPAPGAVLAKAEVPPPPPAESNSWGWFNDPEPEPMPVTPPALEQPAATPRRETRRQGNSGDVGELDRHRMNLEE
ncbi:hypothetical protein [Aurantiacibacter hainanensis]|uniref:hypothetical protein n=1 Tax=Aurantiacibacter hainanensis TaxID=3076114 RepID=UPI0030C6A918